MLPTPQKLREKIIKYGTQYEAMYATDTRKTNYAADKLHNIMQIIKSNIEEYRLIIDELLYNDNIGVVYWVCGIAWESQYRVEDVKKLMLNIIKSPPNRTWKIIFSMSYEVRSGLIIKTDD